VAQRWKELVSFLCIRVQASLCTSVTPRCFTCSLGLQDIQWVRELVVVRVNWFRHPVLPKKKRILVVLLPPSQLYLVCSSSLRSASSAILVYWNTLKVTIFFFYQHLILQCIKYISFLVLDNLFLSFPSCFMVKSNTYASAFRKFILLVIF
jgi:hypothetical protein